MRHTRLIVIFMALLLGACGDAQQAAEPAATVVSVPSAAPALAATSAQPTESAVLDPGSVPAPSPTPAGAAALPTEPTAQLILPAGTPIPATDDAPRVTLTPSAAAQQAVTAPVASDPVRLVIKDINLDGRIVSVGLDKNRVPVVPEHNVGWYNLSARPGQGENIVLWGHVLRFRNAPNIPAPFAHIKELKEGAEVILYDQAGNIHNYVVTKQIWVKPDQVEYILPQGKEMLTMVSCIGDKVIQSGEVVDESHRLITIAEPVS
jgi:LPXTG-site transpeptidase (sortase) family protein